MQILHFKDSKILAAVLLVPIILSIFGLHIGWYVLMSTIDHGLQAHPTLNLVEAMTMSLMYRSLLTISLIQ